MSTNKPTIDAIADSIGEQLARHIMKIGDEPGMPTHRIEFKIGTWRDEKSGGGLNEASLATEIAYWMKRYLAS